MGKPLNQSFQSRRNRVRPVQTDAGPVVVKTFCEEASFQKELKIYKALGDTCVACPKLLAAEDKTLVLSRLPGDTLVDCLQQQEQKGLPVWKIWEQLTDWLISFWKHTGFVMTDVNLRNFLYEEKTNTLYGLDFEQCEKGSMASCAAALAAFIRTYRPEHTPLKLEISQYILALFAEKLNTQVSELAALSAQQEERILQRRKNRI